MQILLKLFVVLVIASRIFFLASSKFIAFSPFYSFMDGLIMEKVSCLTNSKLVSHNFQSSFQFLTHFHDSQEDNIPSEHRRALLIITYIGCSMSLVGEVMVIFVYVTFMWVLLKNKKQKQKKRKKCLTYTWEQGKSLDS